MVEYGNGIGQGPAGQVGGHGGGPPMDFGAQIGQFVTDSVHTISTLPPAELVVLLVVVVGGLLILKRAF